jgi:hypothetical protein
MSGRHLQARMDQSRLVKRLSELLSFEMVAACFHYVLEGANDTASLY